MKAVKWLAVFPASPFVFLSCSWRCCAFVPFPRWLARLLSVWRSFVTASIGTGAEFTDRCWRLNIHPVNCNLDSSVSLWALQTRLLLMMNSFTAFVSWLLICKIAVCVFFFSPCILSLCKHVAEAARWMMRARNSKLRSASPHLKSIFMCFSLLMTGHLKTLWPSFEMEPGALSLSPAPGFLPPLWHINKRE